MTLQILINNSEFVFTHLRLDLSVVPELFVPIVKTSVLKTIVSSLSDIKLFNYKMNKNLDGILINVVDGKRTVETSLSREESFFLLKERLENGCVFKIYLEIPLIGEDSSVDESDYN